MKEDPINKLHPIKDKSRICMKNNSKKSMIYRTKKSLFFIFFFDIRKYEHICFESGNDTYQPNVYLWRNLLFSAPIILQSNYCAQMHLLQKEKTMKGILITFFEPINYEAVNLHIGSFFFCYNILIFKGIISFKANIT